MRLWHKKLIPVLPRAQLVAQWRECSAIASTIQKTGTPNHILVNYVTKFDYDHFITYAKLIRDEMTRRHYRTMDSVWQKIVALKPDWRELDFRIVFASQMDNTYLAICYYNLLEKYLRGGISSKEWESVVKCVKQNINLTEY